MIFVSSCPARAHEGPALLVLLASRRLSHEHQVGGRVAVSEHDLRARLGEPAAGAALDERASAARSSIEPRSFGGGRGGAHEQLLEAEVPEIRELCGHVATTLALFGHAPEG